jgi:hypothetical protein
MHILLMLAALLFAPFTSPTPDQCAEINRLLGGETIPWLGYEQGGWDLPSDLKRVSKIDFAEGGLWLFTSESVPDKRWYWWFFTYEATTDANGNHNGMHEFCALAVDVASSTNVSQSGNVSN